MTTGKHAGLQAKIRQVYPEAVYFHCYANKVALVVTDVCKIIENSSILFNALKRCMFIFLDLEIMQSLNQLQKSFRSKNLLKYLPKVQRGGRVQH